MGGFGQTYKVIIFSNLKYKYVTSIRYKYVVLPSND